jgi:hypothetical protein
MVYIKVEKEKEINLLVNSTEHFWRSIHLSKKTWQRNLMVFRCQTPKRLSSAKQRCIIANQCLYRPYFVKVYYCCCCYFVFIFNPFFRILNSISVIEFVTNYSELNVRKRHAKLAKIGFQLNSAMILRCILARSCTFFLSFFFVTNVVGIFWSEAVWCVGGQNDVITELHFDFQLNSSVFLRFFGRFCVKRAEISKQSSLYIQRSIVFANIRVQISGLELDPPQVKYAVSHK